MARFGLDGFLASDALRAALTDAVQTQLAPIATRMLADAREQLLAALTPAPPTNYTAKLKAIGLNVTDDIALVIWRATFAAIAEDRAPAERPPFTVVPGGANRAG